MKLAHRISNHQIESRKIYLITVLAIFATSVAVLLGEILVDLQATRIEILVPLIICNSLITLMTLIYPDSRVIRSIVVAIAFLFAELHFIINPEGFYIISFWLPFIPLISLIIQGIRAALIWTFIILIAHILNSTFVIQEVGALYTLAIKQQSLFIISFIFILSILTLAFLLYKLMDEAYSLTREQNNELTKLQSDLKNKSNILEKYITTLISISKDETIFYRGRTELFRRLCLTAANALQINRVSIWLLHEDKNKVERQHLYDSHAHTDEVITLERRDYPLYFKAIESKPFIMASNARTHPETKGFATHYLDPLDIHSLLDCPIIVDRETIGVICCEHRYETKNWNTEDALFIQSLADFISLYFKNLRIKKLLNELSDKNVELTEKNHEIEAMNDELNGLNMKLKLMNDSLEEKVKARTYDLETQNNQLTEYAFINSHLLRAPLSRILGLSTIIATQTKSVQETELIQALITSSQELDAIIRNISDILYDGNNLTREDIKMMIDRTLNK